MMMMKMKNCQRKMNFKDRALLLFQRIRHFVIEMRKDTIIFDFLSFAKFNLSLFFQKNVH